MAKKPDTKGDKGVPELIEKKVQVLTWNIAGSKSEAGFADIRDTIAPTLKGLLNAECVTFFQEMSSGVRRVLDWGFKDVFAEVGGGKKEAGISTPQGGRELSIEADDILGKEKLKNLGVEREIIDDERLYGRTITITCKDGRHGTEYSCQIAVLSYHAPYKTEDKQTKMVNFFGEMCKLANKLKKTIIIGGDFNLPVLDWKDETEKRYKERVSVALYVASPRRWDNCIDTFAIVQPTNELNRTECCFNDTFAIYLYPLVGRCGGGPRKPSTLQDYPSHDSSWFKYIHYSDTDKKRIEEKIKEKCGPQLSEAYSDEFQKRKLEPGHRRETVPPWPAPLWPTSPLHQVLDHDPVLTNITLRLKRKEAAVVRDAPDTAGSSMRSAKRAKKTDIGK